jgi:Zn-dependent protease with chaperone function
LLTPKGRTKLKGISANEFITRADSLALDNIKKLPVLPELMQKFNELALDRVLYVHNTASAVRCTSRQFSTLAKLLKEACKVLDMDEPELYVRYHVADNAYTAGVEQPFIVLHSPIIDSLTDDELLYVIGHELGHIKCAHVLYQMIGWVLIPLIDAIGSVTLGLGRIAGSGVKAAFFEWMRQAEFTCDRAGLLVCQDPMVAMSATMKIGCGNTRLAGEMSVEAFLQQAREHTQHTTGEGVAKALMFILYKWTLSHPEVVYRAKALDEWVQGGAYGKILAGDYARG